MSNALPPEIKIAKEASITAGGIVLGGLFRYLFNVVVARFLGVELLGFYAINTAVTQVATILGKMGLDLGTVRFVSRLQALGNIPEATATIRTAIIFGLVSSLVVAGLLLAGAGRISADLFHAQDAYLGRLLFWFALTVPLAVVAHIAVGASQGFKVLKHRAFALHVFPMAFLCTTFLALVGWAGPLGSIVVAYVGSQIVSIVVALYLLTRLVPVHRPAASQPQAGLLRASPCPESLLPSWASSSIGAISSCQVPLPTAIWWDSTSRPSERRARWLSLPSPSPASLRRLSPASTSEPRKRRSMVSCGW